MLVKQSKKYRETTPKVAVIFDVPHLSSRNELEGVFVYARHVGGWDFSTRVSGVADALFPNLAKWDGDGVVARIADDKEARELLKIDAPIVFFEPSDKLAKEIAGDPRRAAISIDDAAVGKMAAKYLLGLNSFENYGLVGTRVDCDSSRKRLATFQKEIGSNEKLCFTYPQQPASVSAEVELERLGEWLTTLPKPFAVFATTDERALDVLRLCKKLGLEVPYDVAILGVGDDENICNMTTPGISSVSIDYRANGHLAARMLEALMRGLELNAQVARPKGVVTRGSTATAATTNAMVRKALYFIKLNAGRNVNVADVAEFVGATRQWLERLFIDQLGRSVHDEIDNERAKKIEEMLVETNMTVKEIGVECGFVDGNHLATLFRKRYAMTPLEYRKTKREEIFMGKAELLSRGVSQEK
ncbi:MAG: substrate-binding domain-containing protein [Thermoguttaceae bacterium]|nr:substrate-binding domain-containing protein [Thermoguttaceae bacterium]